MDFNIKNKDDCENPICYSESSNLNKFIKKDVKNCPLNREKLGTYSWGFMHSFSFNIPETPTEFEKGEIKMFVNLFTKYYPCKSCSSHFQYLIRKNPIKVNTKEEFTIWLCERHNEVNEVLNKKKFNCEYNNLKLRWFKNDKCLD